MISVVCAIAILAALFFVDRRAAKRAKASDSRIDGLCQEIAGWRTDKAMTSAMATIKAPPGSGARSIQREPSPDGDRSATYDMDRPSEATTVYWRKS